MATVPKSLYRGMSWYEYELAEDEGYFQSKDIRLHDIQSYINRQKEVLAHTTDPAFRRVLENEIAALEAREQRDAGQTFWADTPIEAKGYGSVLVAVRTQGIEHLFRPFPGRLGEWVTSKPVPITAKRYVRGYRRRM